MLRVVPASQTGEGILCIEMRIRLYNDGTMSQLLERLAKVSWRGPKCKMITASAAAADLVEIPSSDSSFAFGKRAHATEWKPPLLCLNLFRRCFTTRYGHVRVSRRCVFASCSACTQDTDNPAVQLQGPFIIHKLVPPPAHRNVVMIAAGTGINPSTSLGVAAAGFFT